MPDLAIFYALTNSFGQIRLDCYYKIARNPISNRRNYFLIEKLRLCARFGQWLLAKRRAGINGVVI